MTATKHRLHALLLSLLLCLGLLGIYQHSLAQMKDRITYYLRFKAIDTTYLKCEYRYAFVDSGKTDTHLMVLLVGNKVQKFQGDDDYQSDSLGVLLDNKSYPKSYIDSREKGIPFFRSGTKWSVYLGYPEGKVSIADRVFIDNYLSEEPLEPIQWKINEDSVKNLMGYDCIQAECDLYGRHWVAWYAPELPCSSGPWLLRGLPGLIVQAYDTECLHDFLLLSVADRKIPIPFIERNYFKSEREKVIKAYMKYAADPGKVMFGSGLVRPIGKAAEEPLPRRRFLYTPLRRVSL
nr:GLPGLI family protein [uncultured Porphyromonas sp.]